jgi:hypothetical protein
MIYEVTLRGTTPLLCNKFTDAAALDATTGASRRSTKRQTLTPRDDAESRLYKDDDGHPVIQHAAVFGALINAGSFFKSGKKQLSTSKSSLVPAAVVVHGLHYKIEHTQPWSVDARPICNPGTGGRFLRYRPRFDDWSLKVQVEILDQDIVDEPTLRELFDKAGAAVGIGDFRPSRRGPFGKFRVDGWRKLN